MSPPEPGGSAQNLTQMSMLTMDGARHRRYRELVQPSFNPDRMPWWIENWVRPTIESLIDSFEANGRADLNVEFCAAIPLLTICGSFGIPVRRRARHPRGRGRRRAAGARAASHGDRRDRSSQRGAQSPRTT